LNVAGLNVAGLNVAGLNVAGLNVAGLNVAGLNVAGLNVAGLNVAGLNVAGLNVAGGYTEWSSPSTSLCGGPSAAERLSCAARTPPAFTGLGNRNVKCGKVAGGKRTSNPYR
jgi:hypothetical protein